VPHDYYTGFRTEMPFKIALSTITLALFIMLVRQIYPRGNRLLRAFGLFISLVILAWFLSFTLWFEF
jgi:hypothetical protein